MAARVSVARQVTAYVLLQLAALSVLAPWGLVAGLVLVIAAIWLGVIPFCSFTSARDFIVGSVVLIIVLGGMFAGAQLLLHLRYHRAAEILVVAFPVAVGAVGIRQALRTGAATSAI